MIVIIMGVAGSGKTTVGKLLAATLNWEFVDADDFHSPANLEKITRGIALDDSDRRPWLESLRVTEIAWVCGRRNVILACSALKRSYRVELRVGTGVKFVYLQADRELIAARLANRQGHFASEDVLESQFAALEEPDDAVTLAAQRQPAEIVCQIIERLHLGKQNKAEGPSVTKAP